MTFRIDSIERYEDPDGVYFWSLQVIGYAVRGGTSPHAPAGMVAGSTPGTWRHWLKRFFQPVASMPIRSANPHKSCIALPRR